MKTAPFGPDGRRLLPGNLDGNVQLWDAVIGRQVLTLKGRTLAVTAVAFVPDKRATVQKRGPVIRGGGGSPGAPPLAAPWDNRRGSGAAERGRAERGRAGRSRSGDAITAPRGGVEETGAGGMW